MATSTGTRRVIVLLLILLLVVVLIWGAMLIANQEGPSPSSPPAFSVGTPIEISAPNEASVSVLESCPSPFWRGVIGIATHGQRGEVRDRRVCDDAWWYQVVIPELESSDWGGIGWLPEENIRRH